MRGTCHIAQAIPDNNAPPVKPNRRQAMGASHPRQPAIATGYADGAVLLVRIDDGALMLARQGDGEPVTAIGWNATGQMLAYGTEAGRAGVLRL